MPSRPINDGLVARSLVLFSYKVKTHRFMKWLWKTSYGLPSFGNFCVKVTASGDLAEASAMRFVAEHTKVPVPKVYCAFIHKNRTYILMSKIDGQPAMRNWVRRSLQSKEQILHQLQGMIDELRSITRQSGTGVANVDGGRIRDCRLPLDMYWGPFDSTRQFHEALALELSLDVEYRNLPDDLGMLLDFYRHAPENLVFTHADLSSLNILVKGDDVVGIVDWETAGWFPPYWEYVCAWNVNPMNPFWQDEVDKFLIPMPYELKMDNIRRKHLGAF